MSLGLSEGKGYERTCRYLRVRSEQLSQDSHTCFQAPTCSCKYVKSPNRQDRDTTCSRSGIEDPIEALEVRRGRAILQIGRLGGGSDL